MRLLKKLSRSRLSAAPRSKSPPLEVQPQPPQPWDGSMMDIYDFVSEFRQYFIKHPHSLPHAVAKLHHAVPFEYQYITAQIPHEYAQALQFLDLKDGTTNGGNQLLDYFLARVQPPLECVVQLAHTHAFMTAQCVNLSDVQQFNTYHWRLSCRTRASEEIRKYNYIQALDKNEFSDIRMEIDPQMSYKDIQQYVLMRATAIDGERRMGMPKSTPRPHKFLKTFETLVSV